MPFKRTTLDPVDPPQKKGNRYVLDDAKVVARYAAGETALAIATSLGVSAIVVDRRIQEAGVAHHPRSRRRDLPVAEIAARYRAGESELSLSGAYGVDRSGIRRRLVEAGVEIRGPLVANRLMAAGRTPEMNRALTEAAHAATKGRPRLVGASIQGAKTREARGLHASANEILLAIWLKQRGITAIPQQAVGPYNVDLGAYPVAVEIFGGHWHKCGRHLARAPARFNYLLDQGWSLMVVWVNRRNHPLTIAAADEVAAFVKLSRGDPSLRGQKRVIWGDGHPAGPAFDFDHFAPIQAIR